MTAPAFPITVSQRIYDAMCEACGQPYADSYLWNATLNGDKLTPHTMTAYLSLKKTWGAQQALKNEKIALVEPKPFPGHPARPSARELVPELFGTDRKKGRSRPDWDAY